MRIKIKTDDVSLPFLPIPNHLIGNRLTLRILAKIFPDILPASKEDQREILRMYRKLRRSFGGMTLENIHPGQGEAVNITS